MTQRTNSRVPKIRFKGFETEWEEMPMGRLLTFKNGYNASKSQYGRGEKFINVLDIIRNDFITYDKIIGRVSISRKQFEKYKVVFGDILFQRSSETLEEVGQANVYLDKDRPATFGGFVIRGRPLVEFNPAFFNATLKSAKSRRDITSRSGGSTRYNIGQESLEASSVSVAPDLREQGKVADFVMSVDRLIGLQQRKHDNLVTLKKAMLQKFFPQPGATTPEIRFKGYSGAWAQRSLRRIAGKVTEKNITKEYSETLTNSAEFGVISQRDYFEKEISNSENIGGYYIVEPESFVYNPRISELAPVGPVNRNKLGRTGIVSPLYTVFRTKDVDNTFLEYFFKTYLWHPFMFLNGDTGARADRFAIKDAIFMELPVPYPDLTEQQKIGSYFHTLDELISQHALRLQKVKQVKLACLEKMFV